MSYGYTRTPSAAQARRNKARRLVNLSIHEVSSVDSGAAGDHEGRGRAQVLLRKHDEGANEMQIEKHKPRGGLGVDESEKEAMSDFDTAIAEQRYAMKMFPEAKSMAEALAKWHATSQGKAVSASFVRDSYQRQQKAEALGNGYESAGIGDHVAWAGAVRGGVGTHPNVRGGDIYGTTAANQDGAEHRNLDGGVDKRDRFAKAITAENVAVLKEKFGLNFDQAVTMLSRGGK
jgi:hypothetical protein